MSYAQGESEVKNIWIFNHYATSMFKDRGGRHYHFAKNLIDKGYKVTIFCASTIHNSSERIDIGSDMYLVNFVDGIKFVFIKTSSYTGNGKQRIKNMIDFYKNLFSVSKQCASDKPNIILASSVHPLTLVSGIKISKKFHVPCMCEIRDLWPESIIAYGLLKRESIIARILYQGEKWIYKKADSIIMTWEGGKDYIIDQGWDKDIDLSKIKYISNGVEIDAFDKNIEENQIVDLDLIGSKNKNIVYAGSIRKVNNLRVLLDSAKIIQNKGYNDIKFLIYGSGDEEEILKKKCKDEEINNVIFKGRIEKKYIPVILKNAYINILHNSSTSLDKYGQSQNKFFEYLAAGNCIIQTYRTGYSICEKYNCGVSTSIQNTEEIAKTIIEVCNNEEMRSLMGKNARNAAYEFDYSKLTDKLIDVIENIRERENK